MRRARVRIESDRHFKCEVGRPCRAPALRRRLATGRTEGKCIPRKTWWVRFMVDGKRCSEGYRDKTEAETRQRKITALMELDADPRAAALPSAPLFGSIAEEALRIYCGDYALRQTTVENHESVLRKHVLPFFSSTPVDAAHFDREAVRSFIRHLRGGDGKTRILSDASINVVLPTLSIVLNHAVEKKYLLQNPLRGGGALWRREQPPEPVDPFAPEELRAIITSAYEVDHDFGVLVQIAAQTGLRPGEVLGLRRCDLDLARGEVHVRGTYTRSRSGPTKTRSSVRVVSLVDHVVVDEALSRSVIPKIKAMKLLSMDPEDRLFALGYSVTWQTRWKRALLKSGVRYRKPHNLRHAFASILLSRGANILEVQEAGGWSSAAVLLRVYAKWIRETKRSGASMHAPNAARARKH
jgi:integrase